MWSRIGKHQPVAPRDHTESSRFTLGMEIFRSLLAGLKAVCGFGHGEQYVAMTLAGLNLLAFAWHTVLDLLEPPWRRAREAAEKRKSFFNYLATVTSFAVFPAWSDLLEVLATLTIPPNLLAKPKIE